MDQASVMVVCLIGFAEKGPVFCLSRNGVHIYIYVSHMHTHIYTCILYIYCRYIYIILYIYMCICICVDLCANSHAWCIGNVHNLYNLKAIWNLSSGIYFAKVPVGM